MLMSSDEILVDFDGWFSARDQFLIPNKQQGI